MKIQSKLGVTIPLGYKVYRALLSQTGTNAPTAIVLENTLGGIVTFSLKDIFVFILILILFRVH